MKAKWEWGGAEAMCNCLTLLKPKQDQACSRVYPRRSRIGTSVNGTEGGAALRLDQLCPLEAL